MLSSIREAPESQVSDQPFDLSDTNVFSAE